METFLHYNIQKYDINQTLYIYIYIYINDINQSYTKNSTMTKLFETFLVISQNEYSNKVIFAFRIMLSNELCTYSRCKKYSGANLKTFNIRWWWFFRIQDVLIEISHFSLSSKFIFNHIPLFLSIMAQLLDTIPYWCHGNV